MRLLKLVSLLGMGLSLLAHLISWTTPNLLYFALLGIPLHGIALVLTPRLYRERAFPLQKKADLHWFQSAPSWIHGLLFLSILSLMFHTVVALIGISAFMMFLIRATSSLWLYIYVVGYGYTSWEEHRLSNVQKIRNLGRHRTYMQTRSETAKSELRIPPPDTRSGRWR